MFEGNRKGVQVAGIRRTIQTLSAEETLEVGRGIGNRLSGGEIILLTGDLGAGKSVLAHGIALAMGIARWRGSPTFALVHEYDSLPALIHVDLYRLRQDEAEALGLEEYAVPSMVILVEWADRASEYLSELPRTQCIHVELAHGPGDTRMLTVTTDTAMQEEGETC